VKDVLGNLAMAALFGLLWVATVFATVGVWTIGALWLMGFLP
jgi:hypothetical protein